MDAQAKKQRESLSREAWVKAACRTLVERGIENVKVLNLAEALNVTRGSFYWHFESREDLLQELIDVWHRTNTSALIEAANARPASLGEWYVNLMRVWLDATQFDVQLDIAMRDWARKDRAVFELAQSEDSVRVDRLKRAFEAYGCENERIAFTRARILYFQQMGYYMMGVQDPPELRAGYLSEYCSLLTGAQIDSGRVEPFIKELKGLIA
ncbi:TetR/AcrR family transcriptional regulator [Mesorhizobium sp.]|uniref:TetR/AcrR family transcriptional regulator n=1 Tax=Mesorhizobium sp. TaxID=1871066 RepID=UPI0025F4AFDB|nr:TetR/AcrR family transcriptional regulator [Mesorhizobium sp.]